MTRSMGGGEKHRASGSHMAASMSVGVGTSSTSRSWSPSALPPKMEAGGGKGALSSSAGGEVGMGVGRAACGGVEHCASTPSVSRGADRSARSCSSRR